jgi:competence protein ComEC
VLNKEIPFLRLTVPLCAGIISGRYLEPGISFAVISLIVLVPGFLYSLHFNKCNLNLVYGYSLSGALFVCGSALYTNQMNRLSDLANRTGTYIVELSDYPEEKTNSFRLTGKLKVLIGEAGNKPLRGSLIFNSRKEPFITGLLPGDYLRIKFTPVPLTNRGNPDEFDYRFYMANRGIRYSGFISSENLENYSHPVHRKLRHSALIIRDKIIRIYEKRGITGRRLALVAAITLGQRSMLDQEQKQSFIKAGVMHIMAVSGLHAVILSMFFFNVLFFLKRRLNILRVILTILFLWFFAFVTGLTPSVLRATLMFSFLQTGNLIKRNVNSINSVLASAFMLIVIQPSVLFDTGFLLSYSAVIFIICFYRSLYMTAGFKNRLADKAWQSAAVTLLAQAGTLPLTISAFNRFPTWFILTNLIIVPLSSLMIIIGCMIPLTYPIGFVSHSLAVLLNFLTGLTETLTIKASSLPLSTIENIGMGRPEPSLLFATLFFFLVFLFNKRSLPVLIPLLSLLLFILAGSIREFRTRTSSELIVYNGSGGAVTGIRNGKLLNLYCGRDSLPPEVLRHSASAGLQIKTYRTNGSPVLIEVKSKRILISGSLNDELLQVSRPGYVILTGTAFRPLNSNNLDFRGARVILTSEVSSNFYLVMKSHARNADTLHYIKKSGAFRMKL